MGSSYNQEYVAATQYQADKNLEIAESSNEADYDIAKLQSDAVTQQAKYDYEARIYEADKNYQIQMEALRVREKEAELQYKVDWKNAENDAMRAQATLDKVGVDQSEQDNERAEIEYEHEEEMDQQSSADSSYWYG